MITFLLYLLMLILIAIVGCRSMQGLLFRLLSCNLEESPFLHLPSSFQIDCATCIRMGQHSQDGLHDVLHFFIGKPLLLAQHLLTNESLLDVGVVDGGPKLEEWKFERKLLWEVDIEDELEALIGTALRSVDEQFPVVQIFLESGEHSSR